ncbi:hypothetical protein SDC9_189934 [bioreactor metagenome]|uniref:Uncharacterized protein n=1 Tax=bioreactor metagenome TaxID=1076179 RepID=A0A645HTT1_9ZZZZ
MQLLFQTKKSNAIFLSQSFDRHIGPRGYNVGNVLLGYRSSFVALLILPLVALGFELFAFAILLVTQCRGLFEGLIFHGFFFFGFQLIQLIFQVF